MKLRRWLWLSAGAVAGGYLAHRRRRNLAMEPAAMQDHEGRTVRPISVELAGGESVAVVVAGTGPPILLIPGLSGDREVYERQVSAYSREYRVIVPELRLGFDGLSRDFDQFARDMATVLDAFDEESAVVLGLSFGGAIALRFATLYPRRVRALILTNTLTRLELEHVGFNRTLLVPLALFSTRYLPAALARRFARVWGRLGVWIYEPSPRNERVVDYELDSVRRVPVGDGTARMDTFRERDLRPDLPKIEQPTLLIRGAADRYCLPEWQREIARLLPDVTYVEIPDAGHLALISHSETFNRIVLNWLAELPEVTLSGERAASSELGGG